MIDWFLSNERTLVSIQLVVVMLAAGAHATPQYLGQKPTRIWPSLCVYFVAQYLAVPLLALGICWLFQLPAGIRLGLFLIACLPGGAFSSLMTMLGKGNIRLTVMMTAITSIASVVTVPFMLKLVELGDKNVHVPAGEIVRDVVLLLLIPISLGYAVRWKYPTLADWIERIGLRIGTCMLLAIVCFLLVSGRMQPGSQGRVIPLAIILFGVLAQQIATTSFRILRLPGRDRLAVGVELLLRDINLGLVLLTSLFPTAEDRQSIASGQAFFTVLYYAGVSLITAFITMLFYRVAYTREEKAWREHQDQKTE